MAKPGPISAKPLSVLLGDVFSDAYAKQGFAARELVTRWGEIAGPEFATHSQPLKIQWPRPVEGQHQEPATLVLRVEGPMALESSTPPTSSCSGSPASSAGTRSAGWRCGRRRCRAAPGKPAQSPTPPPPPVAKVAETLGSVEDTELRDALARLGAAIKRN